MTSKIKLVPKFRAARAGGVSVQSRRGPHRPGTPAVLMSHRVTPKVGGPPHACTSMYTATIASCIAVKRDRQGGRRERGSEAVPCGLAQAQPA